MKKLSYLFVVLAVMGFVSPSFADSSISLSDTGAGLGRDCTAISTQSDANQHANDGVGADKSEVKEIKSPNE